jgi:hypothetical protein
MEKYYLCNLKIQLPRAFSTGRALICRCSEKLLISCSKNGSFLECSPTTIEARVTIRPGHVSPGFRIKTTLVKSLHSGDPDVICGV